MGEFASLRRAAPTKTTALPLALIGILSLGLIAYAVKSGTPLKYFDERQYVEIARTIREGKGFVLDGQPTAYRPPAWPLVIAGFLLLSVPESMLSIVPALAMIGAALMAAVAGAKLAGRWGALAGVGVLVYPLNVYTAVLMYPQAFATFLLAALALLAVVIAEKVSDVGKAPMALYVLTGFTAAALALSVPTLAFTGIVVLGWVVWVARGQRVVASLGVAAFAATIGVWAMRNLGELGSPVLLSTTTGVNLLIGNNPAATASSGVAVDIDAAMAATSGMSEVAQDAYLRGAAVDWILGNPGDAFALYVVKVLNYFSPYNQPVTASAGAETQKLIAYVTFGVLILLVIARLAMRHWQPLMAVEKLFLSVWFVNSLVMAVFFTRTRFRQPLDILLLIEAGIACALLVAVIVRRRSRE
jgi:hypothetical protein